MNFKNMRPLQNLPKFLLRIIELKLNTRLVKKNLKVPSLTPLGAKFQPQEGAATKS